MRQKRHPSLAAVGLALSIFAASAANAAEYGFKLLPSLGTDYLDGPVLGGNGWIAGTSVTSDGIDVATVWRQAQPVNYGPAGFDFSRAAGLNDAGDVVGLVSSAGVWQAIHWSQDGYRLLPSISGQMTVATAVNHTGQIVGFSGSSAVLWQGDSLTVLDSNGSTPTSINASGAVVGYSSGYGGSIRAVEWKDGQTVTLSALAGGVTSFAKDISDGGQVVGCSSDESHSSTWLAVRWEDTAPVKLPGLGNGEGCANAVNQAGVIVGSSGQLAARWTGDTVVDLNKLVTKKVKNQGWRLIEATDINDAGRIVGKATNDNTGESAFFLLMPK